jgi:hypothetical protein
VSIVELGAGDGTFLLSVARQLRHHWNRVDLQLVDRQSLVSGETIRSYSALSWTVQCVEADVFSWIDEAGPADLVIANLFLHHFNDKQLVDLLEKISGFANGLIACEPRRVRWAAIAGVLVGLIGGNAVTRHDAIVSVRAGFAAHELSRIWPQSSGWETQEYEAGLFSHAFSAVRSSELVT